MAPSGAGEKSPRRGAFAWAMYDWANSAFATTVVAGFFPIFFKDFWSAGAPSTISDFWLGVTVSLASLTVAVLAPVLGSLADQGGLKKRFLGGFAATGALLTALLAVVPQGGWPAAAVLYGAAFVAWLSSCVFYDSLLVSVSDDGNVDRVSGFGFGLGYLGGGLLFLLNVLMTQRPEWFRLVDPALAALARRLEAGSLVPDALAGELTRLSRLPEAVATVLSGPPDALAAAVVGQLKGAMGTAVQLSFVTVAVWWALFSLPLLLRVREPGGAARLELKDAARNGWTQLVRTFGEIRRYRPILFFLLAYWLYIDGVDTVITMAVAFGKSLGFQNSDLITALLVVQFVGFPCAIVFGWLGQKLGAKRFILVGIAVYLVVIVLATQLTVEPYEIFGVKVSSFMLLALLVASSQGGVQALSRSFYARLIPPDKAAEFFGFYNIVGRFAAIIGPALMGSIGRMTGSPRIGIASIAILLLAGGLLLGLVRDGSGREQ